MATRIVSGRGRRFSSQLKAPEKIEDICIELLDHSTKRHSAIDLFRLWNARDPQASAARLATQFVQQNRPLLDLLDVRIDRDFDGQEVMLEVHSGSAVGAIPLLSPTSAQLDYGLVIQPRFPWPGIGPMLAEMGWRVFPRPLLLPLLKRSERRVPAWVLSSMVLPRMKALLDTVDRRFDMAHEILPAPRGRVDWAAYATRHLVRGQALQVPCSFPDLRADRQLLGAIRHTVERQLQSLESQRAHGAFVMRLIEAALAIAYRVRHVPPFVPSPPILANWLQRPLRTAHFTDGLQAIQWTVEDRGLAGISDLEGIPWTMPMEQFFEAWVETILAKVAQQTGGHLRTGRKRETVHPIQWDPAYLGSQRSLIPDLCVEYQNLTLIVDAKYKRHWEEIGESGWRGAGDELREQHRHDLLQVLAYANLARTDRVVACLVYPCSLASWQSLRERGRIMHRAEVGLAGRRVELWLTAVPMTGTVGEVAGGWAEGIRRARGPR